MSVRLNELFSQTVVKLSPGQILDEICTISSPSSDSGCGKVFRLNEDFSTTCGNSQLSPFEVLLSRPCLVLGFGKGILGIADWLFQKLSHEDVKSGVFSVPLGISKIGNQNRVIEECSKYNVKVIEGAENNIPDEKSLHACDEILHLISSTKLTEEDVVFVLISGGGSALLPHPVPGLSLASKKDIITKLSRCGADIFELNTVRKALSNVKGGKLASKLFPAQVISLIISDVIGDKLDIIASGPTVCPDQSQESKQTCQQILEKYHLSRLLPPGLTDQKENIPASVFKNTHNVIFSCNSLALKEAKMIAEKSGLQVLLISSTVSGEAKKVGEIWAMILARLIDGALVKSMELLCQLNFSGDVADIVEIQKLFLEGKQVVFLSGGETTVKVKGNGKGGRNQEMVLSFGLNAAHLLMNESFDVEFLSCGTDGIDGPTDSAGAWVNRSIWKEVEQMELNPSDFLESNNSYDFWEKVAGHVKTGHTGTNVMDIQMLKVSMKLSSKL